ncbi:MAG: PilZ domain-containing protein [Candidatus Omnitrophica bacterium]|nr:PilZ domain-containing protein [Candidatus Omnitrophota bacterium]
MSKYNSFSERRLYPRIDQALPLKIAANGYDLITSTENISCVGAYCYVSKYIPPFTKILAKLTLPLTKKNKINPCTIECKGVIVRTDDEDKGGFKIAIFFNEIKQTQKQKISQYLSQFLPQPTACLK